MNGFKSKADALKFAIEFTSSVIENKVNYDAAQELFDFICRNVPLPDVEPDKAADFLDYAKTALQMQLDKNEKPKTVSDPYLIVYFTAKDLGYQNVQGTGPDDECSETLQLRKDGYEYTVKIDKRKITF
jgi:hypothetical protein